MKKIKMVLSSLLLGALLVGCGEKEVSKDKKYSLKIGTVLTESDPTYEGLEYFKKEVEEKTNGNIIVELYSGGQLGTDEDILEQAKIGAGVGVITDPGRIANYIPEFGILGGPYLADDYEGALKVMNTSVYDELVDKVENESLKVLSFNFFQGTRNLFTKYPVAIPNDLKGQRIRCSGSNVVISSVAAMGGNTNVLPWSESYQALQQKVIEGVEVHNSAAYSSSIHEVTDYVSLTGHFQLLSGLVISDSWFKKLPEDYKAILENASYDAGKFSSKLVLEKDEEFLEKLVATGLKVVECDREAFKEATKKVYKELGFEDLKNKIDEEIKNSEK